jgi:hypothetical protein
VDRQAVRSYGETFTHQGRQIDPPMSFQENVLNPAALLANEVIVLGHHRVVTSHPFSEQEHADLALCDQPLQVAIDRAEADARQRPAHSLIDLISAQMRMITLQGLVHRG